MDLKNKDILILGGWGLVGSAIYRQLITKQPNSITIASLLQNQAEEACSEVSQLAPNIKVYAEWGDIFVRNEFKDIPRSELLKNDSHRIQLAADVLEPVSSALNEFFLYQMILRRRPHLIIDCVNTATGVAYQDVYSTGLRLLNQVQDARNGKQSDQFLQEVETLLASLYLPQLVKHVQILYQAMISAGTLSYIKVGTTGTGGMGLNIPYTHSEDKPSRVLLSKSCVGGAHSLLLLLMGRTPDAPYTKEIKPAAAIAWKGIKYGEVIRRGQPIPLYDCNPENPVTLEKEFLSTDTSKCKASGENLKAVFIDTGENGTFSLGEFTAISTAGQMEFVTPEEIADALVWEIEGGNSGHDIVGALDAAVLSPSYRAGFMRNLAVEKMKRLSAEKNDQTIAFELLGPPRLSKLLYEAHILKRIATSIDGVLAVTPANLAEKAANLIRTDMGLRRKVISIGIPILLPDGKSLLRGQTVKVPADPRSDSFVIDKTSIDHWAETGWVDLREANMVHWHKRLGDLVKESKSIDVTDTSSRIIRDVAFWHTDKPLDEGEIVGWIFINEDKGLRIK